MSGNLTADVVIVGTGLGGSTLAYGLARHGIDVVLIERGDFLRPHSGSLIPIYKDKLGPGSVVGGPSKFYGAAMYRLRQVDFLGTETEHGPVFPWPITYSDLEPYYCEAEYLYKVHGSSENDPTEPPRSRPWPHPPIPHQGPAREMVSRLSGSSGVPVSFIPRALDYDPAGNGCVLCRHCDAYYCPRDAKMDAEIAALRPALETRSVKLLTNTECLRILVAPDERKVNGIRVRRDGVEFTIHAPVVVVSAGITESPLLLWRSRTAKHPNGLANSSGALGRNMGAHTHSWLLPLVSGVQKEEFHQKTFAINAFYDSAPGRPYRCGTIQAAGYMEAWLSYRAPLRPAIAALLRNSIQTFLMTEAFPSHDAGFELSDKGARLLSQPAPSRKALATLRRLGSELFRAAGYRVLTSRRAETDWHPVGTARMGADPSSSVIDSECRAHDVDGLYVVDASSLPRAGALNTGLTIAALALRAANTIRQNVRQPAWAVASASR